MSALATASSTPSTPFSTLRTPPAKAGHVWVGSLNKSVKFTQRGKDLNAGYIRFNPDGFGESTITGYKTSNGVFYGTGVNRDLVPGS